MLERMKIVGYWSNIGTTSMKNGSYDVPFKNIWYDTNALTYDSNTHEYYPKRSGMYMIRMCAGCSSYTGDVRLLPIIMFHPSKTIYYTKGTIPIRPETQLLATTSTFIFDLKETDKLSLMINIVGYGRIFFDNNPYTITITYMGN